ncbi:hypothetical protein DVH24_032882 [Malus domestica]|uniref:Protein kinase domain-containing protein n=1 Tax=Malus domestica TaxID=3750 RepID=A0A498IM25_MALDO|nr:hypothetical protein DVH24_032882 [Malus domestica]
MLPLDVLLLQLNLNTRRIHSWPGYSFSRGQSKQSLFLVSLFEQCPYVKMELRVTKYLLFARFSQLTSIKASTNQTSSAGINGTIGYVVLEALITGYVYSFEILLQEMFTRKGPTDNVFNGDLNLHYADLMYLQVSFATFSKATDQFSSVNLTGVGSFEFVFKRVLYADNRALLVLVAMKVFSMLRHGASKSFIAEYEALRNIKHQNRVKALVYELIQQRSLEEWLPDLHPPLVIEERTSIVYCDLKSSNVLLNTKVTGHVY